MRIRVCKIGITGRRIGRTVRMVGTTELVRIYRKTGADDAITESAADAQLFRAWAAIALNQDTTINQCKAISEICFYWPIARSGGRLLWKLHNKD